MQCPYRSTSFTEAGFVRYMPQATYDHSIAIKHDFHMCLHALLNCTVQQSGSLGEAWPSAASAVTVHRLGVYRLPWPEHCNAFPASPWPL